MSDHSKRPADTPFKQQRLPAWQPILSPPWVICCFLVVTAIFIPIGAVIIVASGQVVEFEMQYGETTCPTRAPCITWKQMNISKDMIHPVYLYYKLDNFYQNHRRYAQSRSDTQLSGSKVALSDITDCSPFQFYGQNIFGYRQPNNISGIYAPCGLIAWSMFNDTYDIYLANDWVTDCSLNTSSCLKICSTRLAPFGAEEQLLCIKTGISWQSDRDKKFKAPYSQNSITPFGPVVVTYYSSAVGIPNYYSLEEPPGYFVKNVTVNGTTIAVYDPDEGHVVPVQTDEDFMVWMRTASLPTFRKLYRKFENTDFKANMALWFKISDRFNVNGFGGHKYIVLSTTTWIGGKNYFLGIAYVVVGSICFLLSLVFLVKHLVSGSNINPGAILADRGGPTFAMRPPDPIPTVTTTGNAPRS